MATDLSAWARGLAERFADRPAVISAVDTVTFRGLDLGADRWAAAFAAHGLGPGAHIGLLAGNGPHWLTIALGAWRAGATLVPISTFVTERELAETLDHADVEVLVLEPRLRSHEYLSALRHCRGRLEKLRTVVLLTGPAGPGEMVAGEFLDRGVIVPALTIDPESIACMLYTSGTTGRPKGVRLSHRAILATVEPTAERTGLTTNDTMLSSLPLFWVAGLVIRALPTLAAGCALILMPIFTPDAAVALIRRHRPTAIHLRPPQVGPILNHPEFAARDLARLRRGGGRNEWYCPPLDLPDVRFITGYGMTEMAGYVVALHWDDPPEPRRSQMGAPLPGVELKIVNPDAASGVGEIRVCGPGLFSGYYKEPPQSGLDAEGFFMSGDLGRLDAAGTLHFAGRSKDLLRVKGINVSPVEVESVLQSHPGVENAYVVGIPVDGLDQEVVALVVAKQEMSVTETALRRVAEEGLSHYKRPQRYLFISRGDVPLGGTGKPQRAALVELAMAGPAPR